MRDFKVKATVIKGFNDSKNGNKPYEANEPVELDRSRFEELEARGFVKKAEVKIETKKAKNEDKDRL